MFTIIGGDGREYGPATVEQIRAWMAAGRANLDTQARVAGSDEWHRLGDFREFGGDIGPPPLPAMRTVASPSDIGSRTSAALVNAMLYLLAMMPGAMIMGRRLAERHPELARGGWPRLDEVDMTAGAEGLLWAWAGLLTAILIQAALLGLRGQNLGKMLIGARVVRADNGQPAGFGRAALLRFLLPVALVLVLNGLTAVGGFLFLVVDYVFMFREDRRCLHDLIAGTKVVRA